MQLIDSGSDASLQKVALQKRFSRNFLFHGARQICDFCCNSIKSMKVLAGSKETEEGAFDHSPTAATSPLKFSKLF